jgi:hypothetical protein
MKIQQPYCTGVSLSLFEMFHAFRSTASTPTAVALAPTPRLPIWLVDADDLRTTIARSRGRISKRRRNARGIVRVCAGVTAAQAQSVAASPSGSPSRTPRPNQPLASAPSLHGARAHLRLSTFPPSRIPSAIPRRPTRPPSSSSSPSPLGQRSTHPRSRSNCVARALSPSRGGPSPLPLLHRRSRRRRPHRPPHLPRPMRSC